MPEIRLVNRRCTFSSSTHDATSPGDHTGDAHSATGLT
jgi:hypothetical protein